MAEEIRKLKLKLKLSLAIKESGQKQSAFTEFTIIITLYSKGTDVKVRIHDYIALADSVLFLSLH